MTSWLFKLKSIVVLYKSKMAKHMCFVSSCLKGFFPPHCRKVLAHRGLRDWSGFLSIIVETLHYKTPWGKCCYDIAQYKLNWTKVNEI